MHTRTHTYTYIYIFQINVFFDKRTCKRAYSTRSTSPIWRDVRYTRYARRSSCPGRRGSRAFIRTAAIGNQSVTLPEIGERIASAINREGQTERALIDPAKARARESAATCSNRGEKKDKKRRCCEDSCVPLSPTNRSIDHSFLPHVIYVGRIRGASRRQFESNRMREASLYLLYTDRLCALPSEATTTRGRDLGSLDRGQSGASFNSVGRDRWSVHSAWLCRNDLPHRGKFFSLCRRRRRRNDRARDFDQFPPTTQNSRSMNVQSCVNVQRELAINRPDSLPPSFEVLLRYSPACRVRTYAHKHAYTCIETYRHTYIHAHVWLHRYTYIHTPRLRRCKMPRVPVTDGITCTFLAEALAGS